jgi:hypothetical protein
MDREIIRDTELSSCRCDVKHKDKAQLLLRLSTDLAELAHLKNLPRIPRAKRLNNFTKSTRTHARKGYDGGIGAISSPARRRSPRGDRKRITPLSPPFFWRR